MVSQLSRARRTSAQQATEVIDRWKSKLKKNSSESYNKPLVKLAVPLPEASRADERFHPLFPAGRARYENLTAANSDDMFERGAPYGMAHGHVARWTGNADLFSV
ncbi:hypothetical protein EVAR_29967_1 [Eumeta japonica]|uniref:Uncharacterized protein n=1 Tax=Eumeta variegata TaxID=151549 RepID=A0A4C1VJ89_EUMVA|nr:hypothetical protein EVAR_29967_1 [Eumeta japonica]